MDYKYIEQLLERYWKCETTLAEEQILHAFFQQKDIPAHLLRYKSLFAYEELAKDVALGSDFDERILAQIEPPKVKVQRIPLRHRMMPLFKAAAVVAVMLAMGTGVEHSITRHNETDYNYDTYKDTYTDPQTAYGKVSDALQMVSESLQQSQANDTDSVVKPDTKTIVE